MKFQLSTQSFPVVFSLRSQIGETSREREITYTGTLSSSFWLVWTALHLFSFHLLDFVLLRFMVSVISVSLVLFTWRQIPRRSRRMLRESGVAPTTRGTIATLFPKRSLSFRIATARQELFPLPTAPWTTRGRRCVLSKQYSEIDEITSPRPWDQQSVWSVLERLKLWSVIHSWDLHQLFSQPTPKAQGVRWIRCWLASAWIPDKVERTKDREF